ncbi:hypothetical protein ACTXT7_011378 [Hymenolepis weldensis]
MADEYQDNYGAFVFNNYAKNCELATATAMCDEAKVILTVAVEAVQHVPVANAADQHIVLPVGHLYPIHLPDFVDVAATARSPKIINIAKSEDTVNNHMKSSDSPTSISSTSSSSSSSTYCK